MAQTYTTSITVDFSASTDSDGILLAEIDSREAGLNNGRSSFIPGVDNPAILVFKTSQVTIISTETTAGNINNLGYGTFLVEEYVEFTNTRENKMTYPISSGLTYTWIGTNHGAVTHTEDTIRAATEVLGVLKVSYNSTYNAIQLANVPAILSGETEFPVLVHIIGEQ